MFCRRSFGRAATAAAQASRVAATRPSSGVLPAEFVAAAGSVSSGPGARHKRSEFPGSDGSWAACAGAAALALVGTSVVPASCDAKSSAPVAEEPSVPLMNWSGTHSVTTQKLYTPETQQELRELVAWAHESGQKIRPVGTCLSPNGLALEQGGMLSMSQLDRIISVDKEKMTITVEGGARVSQILDELSKHGMTLSNFSSITEQQIAGWTQVSAHGTGAQLPTVDEMVTELRLVTPARGEMRLSAEGPGSEIFRFARVGLGSLGIVSQVTLKCSPQFKLHEKFYTTNVEGLRANHADLLKKYRHVRYMWIPYTDVIGVAVSNVAEEGAVAKPPVPEAERVQPLQDLLRSLQPDCGALEGDNFAALREKLLKINPLDPAHVAAVNKAEAEFWKRSTGERIADSTQILGFECGGVQWVLENCFPAGTLSSPSMADIDYIVGMKEIIERDGIAAHSPIEQRWTARSTSPLSPAHSKNADAIFSWVGIIMYITGDDEVASQTRDRFKEYAMHHADKTFQYGGVFHWGKIDLNFHDGSERAEALKQQMRRRFDVTYFKELRRKLDPKGILSNRLIETALVGGEARN
eukprot:TRINITY_DN23829_c0_g1_i2.p1 TRINITY_DN23829_c0_g1~~TRINITY_DN23829_c0_g1_i2.p1  ORF type:complete len:582 (+),score=124.91 TRINITY_DN23829_c0_g1_i2:74-1819(+)